MDNMVYSKEFFTHAEDDKSSEYFSTCTFTRGETSNQNLLISLPQITSVQTRDSVIVIVFLTKKIQKTMKKWFIEKNL